MGLEFTLEEPLLRTGRKVVQEYGRGKGLPCVQFPQAHPHPLPAPSAFSLVDYYYKMKMGQYYSEFKDKIGLGLVMY